MAEEPKRAGWYPDPDGAAGERWWNGASWSDGRRAVPAAAASGAIPASVTVPEPHVIYSAENPAPQSQAETTSSRFARARTGLTIDASANRQAMIGFVLGIVATFFNPLFLLAPVGIIYSILGLRRANELRAQGITGNMRVFAIVGIALGAFALVMGAIQIAVAIFSITVSTTPS
jgi:hypothetical protein